MYKAKAQLDHGFSPPRLTVHCVVCAHGNHVESGDAKVTCRCNSEIAIEHDAPPVVHTSASHGETSN